MKTAYIDGELCGVRSDGVTSFELMQQASDAGYGGLVYFAFASSSSMARTSPGFRFSNGRSD